MPFCQCEELIRPIFPALPPFVDREGLSAGDVVLDVGCGDGRVLVTMAKVLGCRGIGIDVSQVAPIKYSSGIPVRVSIASIDRSTQLPMKIRQCQCGRKRKLLLQAIF